MSKIHDLIAAARGHLHQLVGCLRDRPMSRTGFAKTKHGNFSDGYMEDRSLLAVESVVIGKKLTQAEYAELWELVGR